MHNKHRIFLVGHFYNTAYQTDLCDSMLILKKMINNLIERSKLNYIKNFYLDQIFLKAIFSFKLSYIKVN